MKFVVFGLIGALTATSASQVSEFAAIQRAKAFVSAANPNVKQDLAFFASKHERQRFGRPFARWIASGGSLLVGIDARTGDVVLYTDTEKYEQVNGGIAVVEPKKDRPFYGSEAELIRRASTRLNSLGWKHGASVRKRVPFPVPDASGKVKHSIIYVKFYDEPNGFPFEGGGNFCVIGLDSISGEIVELQRGLGFTYGPTEVGIDSERAIQSARTQIELADSPQVRGPVYRELSEMGVLSSRGTQLCRDQVIPLAFVVSGKTRDAFIAADNGEVLETVSNLTGSARTTIPKKVAQSGASKSRVPVGSNANLPPATGPATWWQKPESYLMGLGVVVIGWLFSRSRWERPSLK